VLRQHKFGGSSGGSSEGGSFSAASGHAQDHARILALGQQELARLAGAAAGSECRESVSWQLARAFDAHARDFDALFEGKVPEDA
jgi:hypothetical protein